MSILYRVILFHTTEIRFPTSKTGRILSVQHPELEMLDMSYLVGEMSNLTMYLVIAAASAMLYLTFRYMLDTDHWSKYGVKQASMPMVQIKDGVEQLIREHGDTVGIKRGKLWLVTRDLSILREVLVKDFNNFINRPFELNTRSLIRKGLFFLKGQDWKRIRQIITPSFSSGKLKNICNTAEDRAKRLTQLLEECARKGQLVPIKHSTGQYTSEIIARTAFGFNTDCLGGEDDEFTYYSKNLFKFQNKRFTFLVPFFMRFPWIQKFLVQVMKVQVFDGVVPEADRYLNDVLRRSLDTRREAEQMGLKLPTDMLQSFINARNAGEQTNTQAYSNGNEVSSPMTSQLSNGTKLANKTMSEDELIAQSLLVIFAGFETTATTLQMCYYLLAKHPDVQDKVFDEINREVKGDCPTYDELSQLTYMEQVIYETLRLYPPVSVVSREAAETKTCGNITIPKGAAVFIPIFSILKDPKHFPDPEKFDPDRFNEENSAQRDPMAFMPFGYGPRLCIGMRLAYLEIKIALAISLRKVQLELNDKTEPKKGEDLQVRVVGITVVDKPITLSAKLRK
ncbi:hypothetical protein Btru_045755 [Bulinus truncatus]|nr:hypothetical protein Btru_045755 [Bulinus truncatus]